MSHEIKVIQKDVVHKICSGQVVLNLATAIKELVENSLDARATIIDVRLKEYGSELIEVVDNGTGIHPDNFQALALKHHTSKLNDFSDLVSVETFGFRGEALSSLCAVSDVTVITRHESEKHGSKITFDYLGVLQSCEPCARQVGTTVSLANLFSSLPVRQKEFHRNLKKEFNRAVQILSAYCLISANVKFTCINRTKKCGKTTFLYTHENKTIRDNISCVFGSKQLSTLLEIMDKTPNEEILEEFGIKGYSCDLFNLQGYISSSEHGVGRSSTDRQFYFVNGRPCEPSKIIKLVNEIYHQYNQNQFPFVLMNVIVSKEMADINVTPDKRLIFLQNENILSACVKSTLTSLFQNVSSTFKINTICGPSPNNFVTCERTKFTFSSLDKWRHVNDKSSNMTGQKRSNNEIVSRTTYKQIKLNFTEESYTSPKIKTDPTSLLTDACIISDSAEIHTHVEKINSCNVSNLKSKHGYNSTSAAVCDMNLKPMKDIVDSPSFSNNSNMSNDKINNHSTEKNLNDSSHCENDTLLASNCSAEKKIAADVIISWGAESSTLSPSSLMTETSVLNSNQRQFIEQCTARKNVSLNVSLRDIRRITQENRTVPKPNYILNKFHAQIEPSKNQLAEEELSKAISRDMFLQMKIIGQFNMGFIITKLENDLFIVDQHATDEKYNFETLQRTTSLDCQKLVIPQDLELTVINECALIDNIEIFKQNGFEFAIDSSAEPTKRVKLISIPVSRNWRFGKEDIDEMLFMLQDAPNTMCRPSRIRAMFASRACRKSVMIGMPLSPIDMKRLIVHMSEIEHPWNCPHGRPTMRHLINLSLLG